MSSNARDKKRQIRQSPKASPTDSPSQSKYVTDYASYPSDHPACYVPSRTPPQCHSCHREWVIEWGRALHAYSQLDATVIKEPALSNEELSRATSDSSTLIADPDNGELRLCPMCWSAKQDSMERRSAFSDAEGKDERVKEAHSTTPSPPEVLFPRPSLKLSRALDSLMLNGCNEQSNTRVLVLSRVPGVELDGLELYVGDENEADVSFVEQTSTSVKFELKVDHEHWCRFHYDVRSDDVVAHNKGKLTVCLVPLGPGSAKQPNKTLHLEIGESRAIAPGCWGIAPAHGRHLNLSVSKRPFLVEFGLLRRQFTLETVEIKLAERTLPSIRQIKLHTEGQEVSCLDTRSGVNAMLELGPLRHLRVTFPPRRGEDKSLEDFEVTNCHDLLQPNSATTIFLGYHSKHGFVVVKIVSRGSLRPEQLIQLAKDYLAEVNFLLMLDHPGIVKIYGHDSRFFMIVMEYINYPDLGKQQDRAHKFTGSPETAVQILRDVANTLAYLEEKGVLHHDIKPRNIINHPRRGAILIDFGLARDVSDHDGGGGTFPYIPPERYYGRGRSPASDIYSLGVTMLYLLGKMGHPDQVLRPFRAGSRDEGYEAWLVQIQKAASEVTGAIGLIVRRMVEETPEARISARQILEELENIEEEEDDDE